LSTEKPTTLTELELEDEEPFDAAHPAKRAGTARAAAATAASLIR
jgi:hypothetical protein